MFQHFTTVCAYGKIEEWKIHLKLKPGIHKRVQL
jgi:hypothetical protein